MTRTKDLIASKCPILLPDTMWLSFSKDGELKHDVAQLRTVACNKLGSQLRVIVQVQTIEHVKQLYDGTNWLSDVIVAQGIDAGGHGAFIGTGTLSFIPLVSDTIASLTSVNVQRPVLLAAGGITCGRQVAAVRALGADGIAAGTIFCSSTEATLVQSHWRHAVMECRDGSDTLRSPVYDDLRGVIWPPQYGLRSLRGTILRDSSISLSVDTASGDVTITDRSVLDKYRPYSATNPTYDHITAGHGAGLISWESMPFSDIVTRLLDPST